MPEFSNYVEGLDAATTTTGTILVPASHDGHAESFTPAQILEAADGATQTYADNKVGNGVNPGVTSIAPSQQAVIDYVAAAGGVTREFNRTFSEEILFDKNEIDYATQEVTGDLSYTLAASGHLTDQFSTAIQTLIMDGISTISFVGYQFIYGIDNGVAPEAGTYQLFFMYRNGVATAHWAEPSSEAANLIPLSIPGSFAGVAGGPTEVDLTWTDVANETEYEIEYSLAGGGGPWLALTSPAAGATSYTHTGLSAGTTYHYRIRAIGDGVVYSNSDYVVVAATTEDAGDVTAPVPTFLPANGNADWPVNKPITITFDEAIRNADGSTIDNTNVAAVVVVKQTNSGGADISVTVTIDVTKMIITITPVTSLGTTQLVYLAVDNVEDVNGNEITLQSITFTTTAYTLFNGTSNRISFGDILDAQVWGVNDIDFEIEITIKNHSMVGGHILLSKNGSNGSNNAEAAFYFYTIGDDVLFYYGNINNQRLIQWDAVLGAGEQKLKILYDGAIDTGNGLDRVGLEIDDVLQGSKSLLGFPNSVPNTIGNAAALLAFGIHVNSGGVPVGSSYFSGEAKGLVIRNTGASVVQLNIPVLRVGTDTSGNGRNGTWV